MRSNLGVRGAATFTTRDVRGRLIGRTRLGNLLTVTGTNAIASWIAAVPAGVNVVQPAGPNYIALGFGQTNLLTANQSSFESGTTGWSAVTNCSIAQSSAQALDGSHSLALTASSSGSIVVGTPTGTSGLAVTQGDGVEAYSYMAACYTSAATTGRSVTVSLLWYNSSGGLISTTSGTAVADTGAPAWTRVWAYGAAPTNTAYVAMQVQVAGCASSEVHYMDCCQVGYAPDGPFQWTVGGQSSSPTQYDSALFQERASTRNQLSNGTSQGQQAILEYTYQLTDPAGTFQEAGLFTAANSTTTLAVASSAGASGITVAPGAPSLPATGAVPIYIATNPVIPPPGPTFGSAATTGGYLAGGTTYYYVITATTVIPVGESTVGSETSYPVPSGTSTNQVTLSWNATSGATTGFNIYRGTSSGTEQLLASVSYAASASTTLTAGVSATATTIPVASHSSFPGSGTYYVLVGGTEVMEVTGGAGTTTWTVVRGALGTTPVAQALGATVWAAGMTYVDDTNTVPSGNYPTVDSTGGGGEYALVSSAAGTSWTFNGASNLLRSHPVGAAITVLGGGSMWNHCTTASGGGISAALTKTSGQFMTVQWQMNVLNS